MAINIALLGFGTVGSSVWRLLTRRRKEVEALLGDEVRITDVVIKDERKPRDLPKTTRVSTDFFQVLNDRDIHVVMEAIVGVEPAFSYHKEALERGIPVITANKAMYAIEGKRLQDTARTKDVPIGYEATVAGGVPIIRTIRDLLHVNRVRSVEGILNGTSNYILTVMRENGCPFSEALAAAQEKGYAEADPSYDIQGMDAFYKLMILCGTVFGSQPDWSEVVCRGIDRIRLSDIQDAESKGQRIKLIAEARLTDDGRIAAKVEPRSVGHDHPLYGIEGVDNAIALETDWLGRLTLIGPGAGGFPTASAMIEDLVAIVAKRRGTLALPRG
jgi:homoserine dehydrogenase